MRPLWGDEEAHTQNTKFVFEKSRSFAFTCFNALFTRRRRPRTQKKVPSRRSLLHKTGGCACDERRTTTRRELLFIFFFDGGWTTIENRKRELFNSKPFDSKPSSSSRVFL